MKKIRSIYLPETVWVLIDRVAESLNCSRSSVVRFAILTLAKDLSLLGPMTREAKFSMSKLEREGV